MMQVEIFAASGIRTDDPEKEVELTEKVKSAHCLVPSGEGLGFRVEGLLELIEEQVMKTAQGSCTAHHTRP